MGAEFRSEKEFRTVIDRVFSMMSEDPDMGPKLRDADVPQRFEFTDLDLVVNIRAARSTVDGDGPRVAVIRIGPPPLRRPLTLVWRAERTTA